MNQLRGDNKQYTSRSAGLTNFPSSQPHELRANRVWVQDGLIALEV